MIWTLFSFFVLILCFNFGMPPAGAATGLALHMENEFWVESNHVTGPAKSESVLTEGVNYLETLSIRGSGQADDLRYRFGVGGKMTDDKNNDIQRYSLTHFDLRLETPDQALAIGDIYPYFGDYALSSALKGVSYRYHADAASDAPQVTLLYGHAAPRWDRFWGGSQSDGIRREVYGARFQYRLPAEVNTGISVVCSQDSDPDTADAAMYDNRTFALDFNYQPLPELRFEGETAVNDTFVASENDQRSAALDGYAMRLRCRTQPLPMRIELEYERVSPEFDNPLGSAVPDREKLKLTGRLQFTQKIQAYTNLLWFRDDLDNPELAVGTDAWQPEVGLACKSLFHRPDAFAKIAYRKKIVEQGSMRIEDNDRLMFNYRDLFGIIEADTNFGIYLRDQHEDDPIENQEFIYNTTLRSHLSARGIRLKPNLSLGGWTLRDELSTADDRARQYAVGLGIDLPRYRISSTVSVGINELEIEDRDDLRRSFGQFSISWNPKLLTSLSQMMLYLRGVYNDFDFSTPEADFREEQILAGMRLKY